MPGSGDAHVYHHPRVMLGSTPSHACSSMSASTISPVLGRNVVCVSARIPLSPYAQQLCRAMQGPISLSATWQSASEKALHEPCRHTTRFVFEPDSSYPSPVSAGSSLSKTNRMSVHDCCHAGKLAWTSADAAPALPHPDSGVPLEVVPSSTDAFTT